MIKWILSTTFIFSLSTSLLAMPTTKDEFCNRLQNKNTIKEQSMNIDNLMGFKNDGGVFNGGVCWWHSRFQRNAMYLLKINPEGMRPSINEAKELIKRLRNSNEVLTLNGFKSFNDFTKNYQSQIQTELNNWQIYDGVVLGGWIDGIKGDTSVPANQLKQMMDDLFNYVDKEKKIAYQKLQIKGITSHAWLVTDIKQTESGYDLGYIDSNDPMRLNFYRYKMGDESFTIKGYGNFVPYLEFKREEEKLNQVANNFCNRTFTIDYSEQDYAADLSDFEYNL